LLNQERAQCGFGPLNQNAILDKASAAHLKYMFTNNVLSHFENQQQFPIGLTGATPADRSVAQGYSGFVSEGLRVKRGYAVRWLRNGKFVEARNHPVSFVGFI
jgi:uncharacterized protein YkwD